MFCKQCGAQVPDGASFCTQCGYPQGDQQPNLTTAAPPVDLIANPQSLNDYLVQNVLSTFCCCLPAGVVGIVFSINAGSARDRGDWTAAQKNARYAKYCFWAALLLGFLTWITLIIGTVLPAIPIATEAYTEIKNELQKPQYQRDSDLPDVEEYLKEQPDDAQDCTLQEAVNAEEYPKKQPDDAAVDEEPAVEESSAEEPAAEEPAVEESAAEEPAAEEPAAEEPAAAEPAAAEPAAEEPAAEAE
ncbi:MAG: CD225/dispanin family protein [Thermoguttaceae bacterium]|nr:CD225/dispanin family protein [Thermoguttaceae bacterium]